MSTQTAYSDNNSMLFQSDHSCNKTHLLNHFNKTVIQNISTDLLKVLVSMRSFSKLWNNIFVFDNTVIMISLLYERLTYLIQLFCYTQITLIRVLYSRYASLKLTSTSQLLRGEIEWNRIEVSGTYHTA